MLLEPPTVLALLLCSGVHPDSASGKHYVLGTLSTPRPAQHCDPDDEVCVWAELGGVRWAGIIHVHVERVDPGRVAVERVRTVTFPVVLPHPDAVAVLDASLGRVEEFEAGRHRVMLCHGTRVLLERPLIVERIGRNGR